MGKEFILPWTCETSDKIQFLIKWFVLISSPIVFCFIVIDMNNAELSDKIGQFGIIFFIYGIFGSLISWTYQLVEWQMYGYPFYFTCKTKDDKITERLSD